MLLTCFHVFLIVYGGKIQHYSNTNLYEIVFSNYCFCGKLPRFMLSLWHLCRLIGRFRPNKNIVVLLLRFDIDRVFYNISFSLALFVYQEKIGRVRATLHRKVNAVTAREIELSKFKICFLCPRCAA